MVVYMCKTYIRLVDGTSLGISEESFDNILKGYENYSTW